MTPWSEKDGERMQYLVSEIKSDASSSGAAKVFNSVLEAVKHVRKMSSSRVLLVDDADKTTDQIEWALAEKLSTITLNAGEKGRKWIITAF